jgi:Fe-S-cluster containining protein
VPRDQYDPADDGAAVLITENPLDRYRRLQRQLRDQFVPFTRAVCPSCPTPCCRRPAAVTALDITLAEELGYQLPAGVEAATEAVSIHLGLIPVPTLSSEGEPCVFLASGGCQFPPDLMPIGCVSFLCPYMTEWYSPEQMGALRAEIQELKEAHAELRAALLRGV